MCGVHLVLTELWCKCPYSPRRPPPSVRPMLHHLPVTGGQLAVEVTQGDTAPILCVHGISSQRRLWDWLRAADPGLSLVMPDLRGRGDSIDVQGASSVAQHAEDLVAVLDALGLDQVDVCGMSMGGFVSVALAVNHPERVRSLVLVDGGLPMTVPGGGDLTPALVPIVFADRLARLEKPWDGIDTYLDFFTSQTAPLLDPADPVLRGYLAHDLDESGRVRLSGDALVSDATDIFFGEQRWTAVTQPTRLLHAEWSVGKDSTPAYDAAAVAEFREGLASLVSTEHLPGLDHAGSIMTPQGAEATAAALREALA